MLRKIYYALSPTWRLRVRRWLYLPLDYFRPTNAPLMPPKGMIYTGSGNFLEQGKWWLAFFVQHAELKTHSRVLDIGSGIGRIALPLTTYLAPPAAEYRGFDAVQQGVDWCQQHISSRYPHFQFRYVDLFNDLYKSSGIDAANFVFPYPAQHFDMACAISVFTHLLPNETANYLRQTYLTMAKGGYLVATFFVLDAESSQLMPHTEFNFNHSKGDYSLMDEQVKAANVAYQHAYLTAMVQQAGFEVQAIIAGYWCGRAKTDRNDFQDIWILRK